MSYNTKRTKALYKDLPAEKLASLAVNHLFSGNSKLAIEVADSAPTHSYSNLTSLAYSTKVNRLTYFAAALGCDYWRLEAQAQRLAANFEPEELAAANLTIKDLNQAFIKLKQEQKAMLEAAKVASKSSGIDFNNLLNFLNIGELELDLIEGYEPNPEKLKYYSDCYQQAS